MGGSSRGCLAAAGWVCGMPTPPPTPPGGGGARRPRQLLWRVRVQHGLLWQPTQQGLKAACCVCEEGSLLRGLCVHTMWVCVCVCRASGSVACQARPGGPPGPVARSVFGRPPVVAAPNSSALSTGQGFVAAARDRLVQEPLWRTKARLLACYACQHGNSFVGQPGCPVCSWWFVCWQAQKTKAGSVLPLVLTRPPMSRSRDALVRD